VFETSTDAEQDMKACLDDATVQGRHAPGTEAPEPRVP
jgi:hypothetical protein